MRFLADMGVARSVVQWLRDGGHDAVHLLDEDLGRLSDPEIFDKAARERRVLLTFDLDFTDIAAASGGKSVSVVLFRLRRARAPQVRDRLAETLTRLGTAIEEGAVVIVQDARLAHPPSAHRAGGESLAATALPRPQRGQRSVRRRVARAE